MKKVLALALVLMLLMSSAALADITVSGWSMPVNDAADMFWDSLEGYDFAVDYQPQPGYSDTVNMLTTMVASGDDSVDVMLVDEIMLLAFTRAGFLAPIDDVVTEEDMADFIPEYIEKFCKYDGKLYAVPASAGCHNLAVNMEMLNAAGVKVPTNEQEFIDACVALTDKENNKYGLVMSLDKASHLQDNINMFCLMFGGNYYDFTLEGTQKAIKFLYDLINTYEVVSKDCMGYDDSAANQAFLDGYAGMYYNWSTVPTLETAGVFGPDKCTWVPQPTFVTNKTMMDGWSWVINGNSSNMEEAKAFVKAQTGVEAQLAFRLPAGGLAANTASWTDERTLEVCGNMSEMFQNYNAEGCLTPRTLSTRHSEFMDVVTGTVQRYLLDEISFDECIETCIAQTEAILEKAAD